MKNPKLDLELEFFRRLPSEIIIDILSRLPIRTIVVCKCVRRSWRDLIQTREFADYHLSKSASGLVKCGYSQYLEIFEFVDEIDLEHNDRHYIPVTELDCDKFTGFKALVQGSANGLLLLRSFGIGFGSKKNALYICNPVTREFIELPSEGLAYTYPTLVTCGFGVSKMSGQYKVVRIAHECVLDPDTKKIVRFTSCVCNVYVLGTGKWRSIAPCALLGNDNHSIGAFVNGSLHWLVTDLKGCYSISCFDIETEIFSTFSPPMISRNIDDQEVSTGWWLVAFEEYLCMCDSTSGDEIVIWLMKEYGDERSWTKGFVIEKNPVFLRDCDYFARFADVAPIKIFKDGDMLIAWFDLYMFYYSSKTKTTQRIDMLGLDEDGGGGFAAMLHSSSFVSLKSCFPPENVRLLSRYIY